MAFYVGQKVVCVDAKSPMHRNFSGDPQSLVEGCIYTVSAMAIDGLSGILGLQLSEEPTVSSNGAMRWYQSKRFRPVVDRKTDISIFTEMLKSRELVRVID